MNVVGINGSGRRGGNTAVMVNALLEGAATAGADTALFELADWTIAGCNDCKACKDNKPCVVKDDMQRFYDVAAETDVLVLGSPIYLDHITAQLMAFIQRTYCYLGTALENYWPNPNTRVVLGITYGAGNAHGYDDVLDWMAGRMSFYYGLKTIKSFRVPSTKATPIITPAHPEVERARAFGETL